MLYALNLISGKNVINNKNKLIFLIFIYKNFFIIFLIQVFKIMVY